MSEKIDPQGKMKYGSCPFASTAQVLALPAPGPISAHNSMNLQVQTFDLSVACKGPDCQLWELPPVGEQKGGCVFRNLRNLAYLENIPPLP